MRREFPNYRDTPEQLADLAGIEAQRRAIYAGMPPRAERLRRAEELFARARLRSAAGQLA